MKIFEISLFWITFAPSYYWLMYVIWFLYWIWAIRKSFLTKQQQETLFFYIFLWVLVWWRLWYALFYSPSLFSDISTHLPFWWLLEVWKWGMSFHGWFLWVVLATYFFAKKENINFLKLTDILAKIVPVWLFFWRIGNYLNKELLWFPYNSILAVKTETGYYFPSPLLEAFLEGGVIFVLLNYFHTNSFAWRMSSLFLIYYWVFRFIVEIFFRIPDAHIWYYFGFLTQGSLLSIPMIIVWWFLYYYCNEQWKA